MTPACDEAPAVAGAFVVPGGVRLSLAVAAASLPEPMLARSGPIPARGQWAFEVRWDGFRALVSTRPYRVRSRRGWDMTPFLPEFAELRPHGVYDAELIALGDEGRPDFPLVMRAAAASTIAHPARAHGLRRPGAARARPAHGAVAKSWRASTSAERRTCPASFTDGHALFDAVCEWEMEGVVAKRLREPYRPGERAWVKTKNREYWRYEMEHESAP